MAALVECNSYVSFICQSLSKMCSGARMHAYRMKDEDNTLCLLSPVDFSEGGHFNSLLVLTTIHLHKVLLTVFLSNEIARFFLSLGLILHKFYSFLAEGDILRILWTFHWVLLYSVRFLINI